MTLDDVGIVLDIIETAFSASQYSRKTDEARLKESKLWASMFAEDDVVLVAAATKALIATRTNDFPPSIGAIKEMIQKMREPKQLTEQEAWAMVSKAVSNSLYEAQKEFDTLPPDIKKIIGSPQQLREWAMMDTETFHSVAASNFMRSHTAYHRSETEMAMMPPDVKKLISGLSKKLAPCDYGDGCNA